VSTRPTIAVVDVTSVQPMSDSRTTLHDAGSVALLDASAATARLLATNTAACAHRSTRPSLIARLLTLKVRNRMIPSAQIEQTFSPLPGQNARSILSVEFGNRKTLGHAP